MRFGCHEVNKWPGYPDRLTQQELKYDQHDRGASVQREPAFW